MSKNASELGVKWIKAESGNTYLCPVDAVGKLSDRTDESLRRLCLEESRNPHNE
jgi:hypothetical protein